MSTTEENESQYLMPIDQLARRNAHTERPVTDLEQSDINIALHHTMVNFAVPHPKFKLKPPAFDSFFERLDKYSDEHNDPNKTIRLASRMVIENHPALETLGEKERRDFLHLAAETSMIRHIKAKGNLQRSSKGTGLGSDLQLHTARITQLIHLQEDLHKIATNTPLGRRR